MCFTLTPSFIPNMMLLERKVSTYTYHFALWITLYTTQLLAQRLVTTSASLRALKLDYVLFFQVLNIKSLLPNGSVTSVVTNLEHGLVGNFNREFTSTQIRITQPSLLKSKAEVRAKLCDSLLYHVHCNQFSLVWSGLSRPQPLQLTRLRSAKDPVELSITSHTIYRCWDVELIWVRFYLSELDVLVL